VLRVVTRTYKNLIDTLNKSNVPPRKKISVLSKEYDGHDDNVGCIAKDVQNYLGNKRNFFFLLLLVEGGVQKMYNYFLERRCKNSGFDFAIQVHENRCMGHCF
jgi:hypothetical protein